MDFKLTYIFPKPSMYLKYYYDHNSEKKYMESN